jgi:hypothetical protein
VLALSLTGWGLFALLDLLERLLCPWRGSRIELAPEATLDSGTELAPGMCKYG